MRLVAAGDWMSNAANRACHIGPERLRMNPGDVVVKHCHGPAAGTMPQEIQADALDRRGSKDAEHRFIAVLIAPAAGNTHPEAGAIIASRNRGNEVS
jgi:hypothetical protein